VEYDSLKTEVEDEKPIKISQNRWAVGFGIGGGPNFAKMTSSVEGFQTLNSFLGNEWRTGLAFSGDVGISHHWERSKYLRSGLGISISTLRNEFFAESEIHDSLFHFLESEGELHQVLLFQYDIGAETDTIQTELITSNVALTMVSVPVIGGFSIPLKNKKWRFLAELGVMNRFMLQSSGGPFVLLNDDSQFSYLTEEDAGYNSYQLDGHLALGVTLDLGRNQRSVLWNPEIYAVVQIQPGIIQVNSGSSDIQFTDHHLGIGMGIRLFLKKQYNRS
jgi:hypothetical protein